jgi:hypothetical protein
VPQSSRVSGAPLLRRSHAVNAAAEAAAGDCRSHRGPLIFFFFWRRSGNRCHAVDIGHELDVAWVVIGVVVGVELDDTGYVGKVGVTLCSLRRAGSVTKESYTR